MPAQVSPGAEQGMPSYPGCVVFVAPHSPRCQGAAQGTECGCGCSSWGHSRCVAPREFCRVCQSHWTGAVGEAAVPAVPTWAGPAACAQQELSFVAGCSVCKKYGASKDWLCCLAGGSRINQVPFLLYLLAIHFYSRLFSRQQ